jgi:hypothetical protein
MASKRDHSNKLDVFAGGAPEGASSLEEFTNELYGAPALDDGRVTIRPIAVAEIRRDAKQPRRLIPASLMKYEGDMVALFDRWEDMHSIRAYDYVSDDLDSNADDEDDSEFMALLTLARSIRKDGLTNPISIAKADAGYIVETGERRWLAYNLLNVLYGEKFAKIPARVVTSSDVWSQASENGARRPLNAIGMARQLALLIMSMYESSQAFENYHVMIDKTTGSDRAYYAQVADGTKYRIWKGKTQRILDVTGLKSRSHIANYRALLGIPDDVWVVADLNNWTEFGIREYMKNTYRSADMSTTVNISGEKEGAKPVPFAPTPARYDEDETLVDITPYEDGKGHFEHYAGGGVTAVNYGANTTGIPIPQPPAPATQNREADAEMMAYYANLESNVAYSRDLHLLDYEIMLGAMMRIAERNAHGEHLRHLEFLGRLSPRAIEEAVEENVDIERIKDHFDTVILPILRGYLDEFIAQYKTLIRHMAKDGERIAYKHKNKGS